MRPWLLLAAAVLVAGIVLTAQAPVADPVLQAMHDEMERSRKLMV